MGLNLDNPPLLLAARKQRTVRMPRASSAANGRSEVVVVIAGKDRGRRSPNDPFKSLLGQADRLEERFIDRDTVPGS